MGVDKMRRRSQTVAALSRDTISDLFGRGQSDQQIAEELGVDKCAVTEQRELMGLAGCTTAGVSFTEEEDRLILSLRNEKGQGWAAIAVALGHSPDQKSRDLVYYRYTYLMRVGLKSIRAKAQETMHCMTCGHAFLSENRIKHRRCDKCKRIDDYDGGAFDVVLASSGRVSGPHRYAA